MFSLVVRDENICRQLLERILPDEKFGEIRIEGADDDLYVETQKSIKFPLGAHGVRLDAFIKSGNVWAEIELQTYPYIILKNLTDKTACHLVMKHIV